MKAKTGKKAIVLLTLLFIGCKIQAQFYKDMSVGLNAGAYIYQGDLTPDPIGSFRTIMPGFSLFAKKPFSPFLAARLHTSFALLKGNESRYSKPEYRQQRNFSFTSPVIELSGQLVWNILGKNYEDDGFMPYVFSGEGAAYTRPVKNYSRMDPAIFGESSEVFAGLVVDNARASTSRFHFSVPVGVGVEYPLSERFSVNIETSYRFVFTDYLDGFSYSANPKLQDHFHSTSAGVIYKFGKKTRVGCPVVKL